MACDKLVMLRLLNGFKLFCASEPTRRDELTNLSALKFCLVYLYVKIAKISFNYKLILFMFYTSSDLIIIILNHNPATSVQASIPSI